MKIKSISILLCVLFAVNLHALCQDSTSIKKSKYELKIDLPKYTYKEYEPVIVNIQLINHDSIPLELWGIFLPLFRNTNVIITDEKGNSWNNDWFPDIFNVTIKNPSYIVEPFDTLFIAMPINNKGEEVKGTKDDNKIYFDNYGFFNPGRYKAYFDINTGYTNGYNNERIKSNEIYFTVTELNDTDKYLLEYYNRHKHVDWKDYTYIINEFGENPFAEHVCAEYLGWKHGGVTAFEQYKEESELKNDYKNFFDKYPNSEYLLIDRFVEPYIFKHFIGINDLKNNFDNELEKFREENKYNKLFYFLKDTRRVKVMLRIG